MAPQGSRARRLAAALATIPALALIPTALYALEPPTEKGTEATGYTVSETIDVELRSLTVRVLDSQGRPIDGLGPGDFELRVGRQTIPINSADWISSGRSSQEPLERSTAPEALAALEPAKATDGNVIVLFIQADFNAVRVKGYLRILPFVREFLDTLPAEDWVATVSFDSHLKLWQDFSRDRKAVADAVERAIRFGAEPAIETTASVSLARSFPRAEAKRAASPEKALGLTARSLVDIPGEKVILYLGWGLGRYGSSGFLMTAEYERTLASLRDAHASVFVVDVTDADYHTLELGIRQVAEDTGGTYAKTNHFARREMLRLTEAISGYYLLTIDTSLLPKDRTKLRLRLAHGGGTVLLRDRRISQ